MRGLFCVPGGGAGGRGEPTWGGAGRRDAMTRATGGAEAQVRFAARRAAALPECTCHRRSSTQRVLQPPPCGRRRRQWHPLPCGRGAQEPPAFAGGQSRPRPKGRGAAPHDPRKARGFMCTQGASRGSRRGAAHLSLRASPRGLTPAPGPSAPPHVGSRLPPRLPTWAHVCPGAQRRVMGRTLPGRRHPKMSFTTHPSSAMETGTISAPMQHQQNFRFSEATAS